MVTPDYAGVFLVAGGALDCTDNLTPALIHESHKKTPQSAGFYPKTCLYISRFVAVLCQ